MGYPVFPRLQRKICLSERCGPLQPSEAAPHLSPEPLAPLEGIFHLYPTDFMSFAPRNTTSDYRLYWVHRDGRQMLVQQMLCGWRLGVE